MSLSLLLKHGGKLWKKQKPSWDDSIGDLEQYRPSRFELLERRLERISKHSEVATAAYREKLQQMREDLAPFVNDYRIKYVIGHSTTADGSSYRRNQSRRIVNKPPRRSQSVSPSSRRAQWRPKGSRYSFSPESDCLTNFSDAHSPKAISSLNSFSTPNYETFDLERHSSMPHIWPDSFVVPHEEEAGYRPVVSSGFDINFESELLRNNIEEIRRLIRLNHLEDEFQTSNGNPSTYQSHYAFPFDCRYSGCFPSLSHKHKEWEGWHPKSYCAKDATARNFIAFPSDTSLPHLELVVNPCNAPSTGWASSHVANNLSSNAPVCSGASKTILDFNAIAFDSLQSPYLYDHKYSSDREKLPHDSSAHIQRLSPKPKKQFIRLKKSSKLSNNDTDPHKSPNDSTTEEQISLKRENHEQLTEGTKAALPAEDENRYVQSLLEQETSKLSIIKNQSLELLKDFTGICDNLMTL